MEIEHRARKTLNLGGKKGKAQARKYSIYIYIYVFCVGFESFGGRRIRICEIGAAYVYIYIDLGA